MEDVQSFTDSGANVETWILEAARDATPPAPAPTRLGRIVSISGLSLVAQIDPETCGAGGTAELRKGEIVRMHCGAHRVFGMVTGLSIPMPENDGRAELYLAEIELVGETTPESNGRFNRGVSRHPALGEILFLATPDDLETIYNFSCGAAIAIGTLHQAEDRRAYASVDGMLGKHVAMLGSTGSGKSCAVALLLRRLLDRHARAHIVLLDMHGEYAAAFPNRAEVLTPQTMDLPYWLFTADELAEIIVGNRDAGAHADEAILLLKELIPAARRAYAKTIQFPEHLVMLDTPTPYALREVIRLIEEHMGRFDKSQPLIAARWLKNRLETLRADTRFGFMFGGITVRDTMADIMRRMFRIPVDGKPLTIVDLSGVPSEVLNVVLSVLCRITFDFALWSRGEHPILLVCEEAHHYVPADPKSGFEPTKNAVARIAKEGRKYGLSLAIVSQRPAEIDPTILSQCNTVVAFRITNARDQDIVRGVMADSATGLLDFLPSLSTGEAIMTGEAFPVPQRVALDELPENQRPRSATADFSAKWSTADAGADSVAAIVDRWRRQSR